MVTDSICDHFGPRLPVSALQMTLRWVANLSEKCWDQYEAIVFVM